MKNSSVRNDKGRRRIEEDQSSDQDVRLYIGMQYVPSK